MAGNNIGSTPWLGDIDQDGLLYIVGSTINLPGSRNDIDRPSDLRVFCIKTDFLAKKNISWGGYMGNNLDGIFRGKESESNLR